MKLDYNLAPFAQYTPPYYEEDLAAMVADEIRAVSIMTHEQVRRRLEEQSNGKAG